MFRKLKNFDFELKIICRFTTIFDSVKNENERRFADFVDERRFVDSTVVFINDENERLFVACFKSEGNERRFATSFNNFDFADRLLTTIFG